MELTKREDKILDIFLKKMELSDLEKIKLIYGWRLIVADLKKLVVLYAIALLLGCFVETFFVHASFFLLRQVAFGIHSKNFYICLVTSAITFPGAAYIIKSIEISTSTIWITYVIATVPLLLLAPIGTAIHPISGEAHVRYLRKRIYLRLIIIAITLLFLPSTISKYIVTGLFIETVTVMMSYM